jgi:hypothetical protein
VSSLNGIGQFLAHKGHSESLSATSTGASASASSPFIEQLTTALDQVFARSKTGTKIEIDVTGPGQFKVSMSGLSNESPVPSRAPVVSAAVAPSVPAAPPNPQVDPPANPADSPAALNAPLAPLAAATSPVPTPASPRIDPPLNPINPAPAAKSVAPAEPQSEFDAYWSAQPAAVQTLKDIRDPAEREARGLALANQGYAIDYQIMVAGWDPLNTMSIRKFYGYTWVPSMLQPPIPVMPGVHFANLPVYDPNSPPSGSIKVSTDFAIGKTVPAWESYNAVTA